ncbi:MAG: thioredoxin-disulfide reductase [Candidatus Altiarchaeales archaeon]|nr:thioredoxin-disulfide reductase [Candidatus Altiarchaeales archaeon]
MYDTIIIGAGVAGLTAAIYASRKRMNFELISSDFGGHLALTGELLNYPGVVKTTGLEFMSVLEEQARQNGVKVVNETVVKVERLASGFKVFTNKKQYESRTVIIASGSKPRKLDVPGEDRLAKKGVAYCSICDGPLFSGMEVAIIGGGNSALEAVEFMKDIASRIYLLVLEGKLSGHEVLQEKARANPKVEIIHNARAKEIVGDEFVSGVKYEEAGSQKKVDVKGVIIEVGLVPNTEVFKGLVELDEHGHIKIDCNGATDVPGVFAAGDCASGHEYQYVIAAGQGCMALLSAAKYLSKLKK